MTRNQPAGWLIGALPIGAILLWPRPEATGNVCLEASLNKDWDGYAEITVYLHPNLAENMEHSDGVPWNQAELREAIESALLSFQESLAVGHPRIRVAPGYSQGVAWNQPVAPGTIHITPWLDPACPDGVFAMAPGGPSTGGRITFVRSGPGYINGNNQGLEDCTSGITSVLWVHYAAPPSRTFRGTLNHELMHLFGALHPQPGFTCNLLSCPAYPAYFCSCSGQGATAVHTSWNCHKWDQGRVQDAGHGTWGSINATERHRESFDGLGWSTLGAPPWHAPLAGLSSNSLPYMFMARRNPDYVNTYTQLYRWVFTTQAWEYWGYAAGSTVTSLGAVDVAYGGSPAYPFIGHAGVESASDPLREIYLTRMTAPNTRTRWALGTDVTPIDGVGIAWNAGAARFIVVWRADDLSIRLRTATSSGVFGATYELRDDSGALALGAEAPSIDCGPSSIGANPCVLAWASPIPNGGTGCCQLLNWVHIGFNGTSFTRGNLMQQGISLYGPPHVAYQGPSTSSTAFLLAHRNVSNEYFYTIGKSTSETAFWGTATLRSHASGSGSYSFSPAVGSAGGAYELVEQSR